MAVRLSITIPDELHEQLQRVKDSINVSKECQEAISRTVLVEMAKMTAATKKDATIARLRLEREQSNDQVFAEGKAQGFEDAPDMDYGSFLALEQISETQEEFLQMHGVAPYLVDQLRRNGSFSWLFDSIEEANYRPETKERFLQGWLNGVLEFWDSVKDDVVDA